MPSTLTLSEIQAQFADEWVLLQDPRADEANEIQSGQVLCHSRDRDEVYRQVVALRPSRFAILYTGKIPQNSAIVV